MQLKLLKELVEAQWPIGYGVRLRIKRSSVRIRPWPLRWVLGQGSLLPLSQGEAFTLASISYLAILVKYILAKKKKKKKNAHPCISLLCEYLERPKSVHCVKTVLVTAFLCLFLRKGLSWPSFPEKNCLLCYASSSLFVRNLRKFLSTEEPGSKCKLPFPPFLALLDLSIAVYSCVREK